VTRKGRLALALATIPAAAILVWLVRNRDPAGDIPPRPTANASRSQEAGDRKSAVPDASDRPRPSADVPANDAVDAALADFERAFQAASEDELDLVAATRLPDIVRRDPRKAARFAELQPASPRRYLLIRHLARFWGERDSQGALAWAEALPDSQESGLATRAVCLAISHTDPAAAVRSCAEIAAEGDADFQGIFQAWAHADASSAGEWLAAQPANARLEKLRQRYVHVIAMTDPLDALRLAQEGISIPADRDEAVLSILHQWALRQPQAARDWATNRAPAHLEARALAELEGIGSYSASPQAFGR
jgi:hypothetical protein